jgi:hypothetical protein
LSRKMLPFLNPEHFTTCVFRGEFGILPPRLIIPRRHRTIHSETQSGSYHLSQFPAYPLGRTSFVVGHSLQLSMARVD